MQKKIEAIINPRSIAIVGATNRVGSVGLAVFKNLLKAEFSGILYPVNPNTKAVQTVKAYPSLKDIPDEIDLAVIIVPSKMVAQVIEEAGQKDVKGVIVITAGFKEIGSLGQKLENELVSVANKYNMPMIGPNCLGIVNTSSDINMNASFAQKMPKSGNIAFISQSGAVCTTVLDYADGRDIGFSKFISFGNKADINEIDLLRYLKDDPETDVILMYIEDITHGREFLEIAREITWKANKPILAIKSGSSAEGAKAAASHTGSLAGSDNSYDAIFLQSGVQRVESINELFDYAIAFARQPIPKGKNVAIITNAGGPGIMATDAAVRFNLKLAAFSDKTKQYLKEHLPPTANINNPVDVIGDAGPERYKAAISAVLADDNVDSAVIILSPQAITNPMDIAPIIPDLIKNSGKTVLCSFMGSVDVAPAIKFLEQHNCVNYSFPEFAMRTMSGIFKYGDSLKSTKREIKTFDVDQNKVTQLIGTKLQNSSQVFLPQKEANEILAAYDFPLLNSLIVENESDIEEASKTVAFPVAMKICSPDIIHKFDAGGVILKIKTLEQAKKAFNTIIDNAKKFNPKANIKGVLMEEMAKSGVEVILGAIRDQKFGPVCMFGLGGTFVESIRDVTFRVAPMWESSAEKMIKTIKLYNVLKGVRGIKPSDIEAIKNCILRLSQLVSNHSEIAELDINPLIVYSEGEGCVVADSRILLKKE